MDLRSIAESPNCITYVCRCSIGAFFGLTHTPTQTKILLVVGDLQILFGLGQKKIKSFCNMGSSHHIRRVSKTSTKAKTLVTCRYQQSGLAHQPQGFIYEKSDLSHFLVDEQMYEAVCLLENVKMQKYV